MFFITRKRFEEEVRRRIDEIEERRWERERISEMEREIHKRIDLVCDRINQIDHKDDPKMAVEVPNR